MTRSHYSRIWLPAAFFLATPAFAAPIDLQSAVTEALRNNPVVQQAAEKIDQYRYQKYTVRSALFPQLDASLSGSRLKDAVANKTVGSVPFGGEAYNLYQLTFTGEQTLFAYGSFAAVSAADYDREIAAADLDKSRRDLIRNVISVFYTTLVSQNLLDVYQDEQKVVGEILTTAQRRLSLGGKKIDVLQVKTELALLKPKIEKAKSDLASATAELARLMGKESETELSLEGKLPSLKMKEYAKLLDLKNYNLPELKKVRFQKEQVGDQKAMSLGKNLPQLKLKGTYDFLNYTKADLLDASSNSWSVELLLSVPLFSGLSSLFERQALNSQEEQLELQERDVTETARLQQIKSRQALDAAETSLASAEEAAKLAKDSLLEAQRDYRFGIIDFLQFLTVEKSQFEAATSLVQLRFDAINATADYFTSSGQPLEILVDLLNKGGQKR
jgi:outer membrane protein TolC